MFVKFIGTFIAYRLLVMNRLKSNFVLPETLEKIFTKLVENKEYFTDDGNLD